MKNYSKLSGSAMVDLYYGSFRRVLRRITLDIDDTFNAVHGGQQLRLFNAHYDEYRVVHPKWPLKMVHKGGTHG